MAEPPSIRERSLRTGRSRRRHWPFWVAVAFGLVAGLLWIAQDQETLRVKSPIDALNPRFPEYVASLVGAAVDTGDAYTVLRNGDEAFPAMLDAINGAQSRIVFESYAFRDGEIGKRWVGALEAVAKRGVSVRVVLDSIGAHMSTETQDRLKAAGVEVHWFNPLRFWQLEETNYRTHRKVLVVDGDVGFIGGMGVDDQWLGHAQDQDHWRDTQFKIVGPSVPVLEASFYENWLESGGESAPVFDLKPPTPLSSAKSIVVRSNATSGASNIKLLYLLAIAGARRTIDIHSPYVTLDPSSRWCLDEARRRGVKVRILAEGDITDAMPVKHSIRYEYQRMLDEGYQIAEYQPTMMHVKALIIDGVFSLVGSANFGNRSFEVNDELTVAVADPGLAAELTHDFENDLKRSRQLDAKTWKNQRSIFAKAQEFFWSFFDEIF
jgi:cardiolipin synthase